MYFIFNTPTRIMLPKIMFSKTDPIIILICPGEAASTKPRDLKFIKSQGMIK